ncbi:MAG: HipA N-terminal domain-containing protein [Kiritimatiellia bacterium]|jgi:serine/threonine-protein kinase HipA|nr:HipA N-terminal domain-containing protein [Kiritimatiellia bacterium]MDP7024325.1 HipA N-terminal domain-containing protein [Kiritimatiellia bacterium]
MSRIGNVYCQGGLAGRIEERPDGYRFIYDTAYLALKDAAPVSLTLPLQSEPYDSTVLFPFFYGLLAEGILKDTQCRILKLDEDDHFGRLLKTAGSDTIGDVTVVEETEGADV